LKLKCKKESWNLFYPAPLFVTKVGLGVQILGLFLAFLPKRYGKNLFLEYKQ